MRTMLKSLSIAAAILALSAMGARANSVTVDTVLPTNVGLFDGDVGQSGTYFDPMKTAIGTFYGDGVIYAANSINTGVAVAPAQNDHAYMGLDGNEDLILNSYVTSFSFLWGSIDDYNTAETIQGDGSIIVLGSAAALLAGMSPGDAYRPSAWVTITSTTPFDHLEFHSLSPAMEIQFDPPGVAGTPELSTWAMMLLGFVGLGYVAMRKRRGAPCSL